MIDAEIENEAAEAPETLLSPGEIAGAIGLKALPVYGCLRALNEKGESLAKAAEAQAAGYDELADLYAEQGKSKGQQALELVLPLAAAGVAWACGGPLEAAVVLGVMQTGQALISEGGDLFNYTQPIRALEEATRSGALAKEGKESDLVCTR